MVGRPSKSILAFGLDAVLARGFNYHRLPSDASYRVKSGPMRCSHCDDPAASNGTAVERLERLQIEGL